MPIVSKFNINFQDIEGCVAQTNNHPLIDQLLFDASYMYLPELYGLREILKNSEQEINVTNLFKNVFQAFVRLEETIEIPRGCLERIKFSENESKETLMEKWNQFKQVNNINNENAGANNRLAWFLFNLLEFFLEKFDENSGVINSINDEFVRGIESVIFDGFSADVNRVEICVNGTVKQEEICLKQFINSEINFGPLDELTNNRAGSLFLFYALSQASIGGYVHNFVATEGFRKRFHVSLAKQVMVNAGEIKLEGIYSISGRIGGGEGLLMYDEENKLQFLKITFTLNLSYLPNVSEENGLDNLVCIYRGAFNNITFTYEALTEDGYIEDGYIYISDDFPGSHIGKVDYHQLGYQRLIHRMVIRFLAQNERESFYKNISELIVGFLFEGNSNNSINENFFNALRMITPFSIGAFQNIRGLAELDECLCGLILNIGNSVNNIETINKYQFLRAWAHILYGQDECSLRRGLNILYELQFSFGKPACLMYIATLCCLVLTGKDVLDEQKDTLVIRQLCRNDSDAEMMLEFYNLAINKRNIESTSEVSQEADQKGNPSEGFNEVFARFVFSSDESSPEDITITDVTTYQLTVTDDEDDEFGLLGDFSSSSEIQEDEGISDREEMMVGYDGGVLSENNWELFGLQRFRTLGGQFAQAARSLIRYWQLSNKSGNKESEGIISSFCGDYIKNIETNFINNFSEDNQAVFDYDLGRRELDRLIAKIMIFLERMLGFHHREVLYEYLCLSRDLNVMQGGRERLITKSVLTGYNNVSLTITQKEIPLENYAEEQKNELRQIINGRRRRPPRWFLDLPMWAQAFMSEIIIKILGPSQGVIYTIPAQLRRVLGLANYSKHVFTICCGEQILFISNRYRSSLITFPIPSQIPYKQERQRIGYRNLLQLIGEGLRERYDDSDRQSYPILMQTLLSPIILDAVNFRWDNDTQMLIEKDNIIQSARRDFGSSRTRYIENRNVNAETMFISTNYPLRIYGRFAGVISDCWEANAAEGLSLVRMTRYYLSEELTRNRENYFIDMSISINGIIDSLRDTNIVSLRDFTRNQISEVKAAVENFLRSVSWDKEHQRDVALLLDALLNYIAWPIVSGLCRQSRHLGLFCSSLEQILVERIGGMVYGSCKSGKDRKAVEIIHTDAMLMYFHIYKRLPRIDDVSETRKNFVSVFVDLFMSFHHQRNAGQNMPGIWGLRGLREVLPQDIQGEIERRFPGIIESNHRYSMFHKIRCPRESVFREVVLEVADLPRDSQQSGTCLLL